MVVDTIPSAAAVRQLAHFLDSGRKHQLKPDLVHYLSGPVVVADAKYKPERERGDLYQMLAYCMRLGLSDGHLVYVSGTEDMVRVPSPSGTVRLHRHVLDLTLPPGELHARVGILADAVLRAGPFPRP